MECISFPSSMFLLKDKSHQGKKETFWIFYECFSPSLFKLFRDLENVEAGTMKDMYILRFLQIFLKDLYRDADRSYVVEYIVQKSYSFRRQFPQDSDALCSKQSIYLTFSSSFMTPSLIKLAHFH